jgi:glycosyltransferase involved in cell wall biosynthesis
MKLVVALDFRFVRTPDNRVWTHTNHGRSFWDRYLRVFDGVKIVARAQRQHPVEETLHRVDGPGVEFVEVPYYLGPWRYLGVRRQLRKLVCSAATAGDAVLGRVPSRLGTDLIDQVWSSGRPYGLEVIGDPHESLAPGAAKHILRPFFRYSLTRSLKQQCARAAAVSYVTAFSLQKRYPPGDLDLSFAVSDAEMQTQYFESPPRVFTTYYSSTDLEADDYALEPKAYRSPVRPRLIFVGSLAQMYKAPDVLIRAMSLLRKNGFPVELSIIGDGKHRPELEHLAKSLSLDEIVTFMGELPAGTPVRRELDAATLMVLPSRTEGLPRVLIEAMARGLPCVATSVGGIPELLDAEDLVPADDVQALARKLAEILSSVFRLEKMSARNLQKAQEFRPELLEKKRTEFYRFLRDLTEDWISARSSDVWDSRKSPRSIAQSSLS